MSVFQGTFANANNFTLNYYNANHLNAKYADFTGVQFTSFGGTLSGTTEDNLVELKKASFAGATIRLGTLEKGPGSGFVLGTASSNAGLEQADFQGCDLTNTTFLVPEGFVTNYFENATLRAQRCQYGHVGDALPKRGSLQHGLE